MTTRSDCCGGCNGETCRCCVRWARREQGLGRGKWNADHFIQRGVRVEHLKDGGLILSQSEFVNDLQEIQILRRSRHSRSKPSSGDRFGRTWLNMRTDGATPQRSTPSTFQDRAGDSSGHDRSQLTSPAGQERKQVRPHACSAFPTEHPLALNGWGPAALRNRIDGGSTKVLLLTCSSLRAW